MNWTKLPALTTLMAALIAPPATAYADCGQDGQPACNGPVPTVDQVTALLNELTDPNTPAEDKHDVVVTPDFAPNQIGWLDSTWNTLGGAIFPLDYAVTDIQPAPNNFAGATVGTHANGHSTWASPFPIVLVNQNGHWLITHKSAVDYVIHVYWHYEIHPVPVL
jgi:hypothetical protein